MANRKYFDETLRRCSQDSSAGDGGLCLLMCDIDHFKRFNDTWGHLVGDQVIKFIANTLRVHATGDFLAARYGGEEFAIIMPRTPARSSGHCGRHPRSGASKQLTRRSTGEKPSAPHTYRLASGNVASLKASAISSRARTPAFTPPSAPGAIASPATQR
ncbi:MAG: GGDEF domain-containing protein [Hyphomicrobium sp.]|nr:GGDEF domain-containing protein [Hyphomicrobium sp.]